MSQTNAQLLADSLGTTSTGTIPIGGIILWSGSVASIPGGYALCNGSNGTPNLQSRFVVGAGPGGPGYAVAATGGSANAILVSHSHDSGTIAASIDGSHKHTHVALGGGGSNRTFPALRFDGGGSESYDTSTDPGHSHLISGSTAIKGISAAGNSSDTQTGTNKNLPPYYALAYIMRTS